MKKLLVVDACIREENSRTKRIGEELIAVLKSEYTEECVKLTDGKYLPVDKESFALRGKGEYADASDKAAKQFTEADLILIMAPFWDMSFPAALKAYFERISIPNITFEDGETSTRGICKAQSIIYVTTRGMNIADSSVLEQATPYIRAYGHLCGIDRIDVVSAYNMDYVSKEECERKIVEATEKGIAICKEFVK